MPVFVPPGAAFILAGPTASGKTDAAHLLARESGCEILSADSMLVYRGMDIGTAKPEPPLRGEVRYWGLDLADPGSPFSLPLYLREAADAVRANGAKGRGLLVAGGTGLYIKALTEGVDDGPEADPAFRADWEGRVAREGVGPLREALRAAYPALAATLTESDLGNPRRLIRALELGKAGFATVKRRWAARPDLPAVAVLRLPVPLLRARIGRRVDAMYRGGLLEEVRGLLASGLDRAPTACQAIGYAEAIGVLSGRLSLADARAATVLRTSQLAKRQMTWFRNQLNVAWVDIEDDLPAAEVAARVRRTWEGTGPVPFTRALL